MSVRSKPNYGVYVLPLSNAGVQDLPVLGTRVVVVNMLSGATFTSVAGVNIVSGGTPAPNSILNVQIGKALGDPVPLSINGKIECEELFDFVRLSWAAQAGVTAVVIIDDDRAGAGVLVDAPSPILGGSVAISQGGNTAIVTAGHGTTGGQSLQVDGTMNPTPLGASFAATQPGAAGVTNWLPTASNTKGCWLRTAYLGSNTAVNLVLYADTAAPASAADTTKRALLGTAGGTAVLPAPIWLPAGIGLWLAAGAAESQQSTATWDLA